MFAKAAKVLAGLDSVADSTSSRPSSTVGSVAAAARALFVNSSFSSVATSAAKSAINWSSESSESWGLYRHIIATYTSVLLSMTALQSDALPSKPSLMKVGASDNVGDVGASCVGTGLLRNLENIATLNATLNAVVWSRVSVGGRVSVTPCVE